MTFKKNFFSTFILIFNSLLIFAITPMLISMFAIFDVEDKPNIISMVCIMFVAIFVLDFFFSVLNIVTWPFSKKTLQSKITQLYIIKKQ